MKGKRKIDEITTNNYDSSSIIIDEIFSILTEKNIFTNTQIDNENKNIIINLLDKNNNIIGEINGGVGEFKIIENGDELEKEAFSISWVRVDDNYKGYNLGTFLIIYCIYLCKINFSGVEYVVLDDDSDERDNDKNIYNKLGFIYQETQEIQLENGELKIVNSGPEMQLNIVDFFNDNLLTKLNNIKIKIRNLNNFEGGKRKINTRKQRKMNKIRKSKYTNKYKKYRKSKTYRYTKKPIK
jgi:hypothetical protein